MTDHDDQQQSTHGSDARLIEHVRELISMMSKGGICELDLASGDMSIRLRSAGPAVAHVPTPVVSAAVSPAAGTAIGAAEEVAPVGHVIKSPMIGTFYAAPSPGEPPFVSIGDEVDGGQVIGIIEAMKIMNEITADKRGVVVEVMVENAQPVEFGSALMRIMPAGTFE